MQMRSISRARKPNWYLNVESPSIIAYAPLLQKGQRSPTPRGPEEVPVPPVYNMISYGIMAAEAEGLTRLLRAPA